MAHGLDLYLYSNVLNITVTGNGNIQGTAFCDLFTTPVAYLYQILIIKLASERTPAVKVFHCDWMSCRSWHVISVTAVPETNGHWARTWAQRAMWVCLGSTVKSARKHNDLESQKQSNQAKSPQEAWTKPLTNKMKKKEKEKKRKIEALSTSKGVQSVS